MSKAKSPNINDYEFSEKLGSGSYASVFRAIKKDTKEVFAIKVVEKSKLKNQQATDNMITEISLLKRLKHRHIVQMYDFCWDDKNIYLIMELCNAGNLQCYIKKRVVLPESTCRIFLRQLASAMKYLRENDVSHFDLKPQNLMLCRTQKQSHSSSYILKIGDFGFAQHLSLGEENSTVKGSPLYMAPEILLKRCYDPSADLWSIGCLFYESLFGKAPYSSKTLQELLDKVSNKQKIEIPRHSKISSACEDLLTRLLQHDPKNRITFEEFFNHEFIDLKHAPNDENFERAVQVFASAVEEDIKHNYNEAYHLYCEGLQFFVPLIDIEPDAQKRVALKSKARSYIQRAEEIKSSLLHQQYSSSQGESSNNSDSVSKLTYKEAIQEALTPSKRYQLLYEKCASSPQLQNGLEIGRQAELYEYEKKLDLALETFKSALSILVPLLQTEPKSQRKDLLTQQISCWMKEAESIKAFISAQQNMDTDTDAAHGKSPNCIMS